METNDNSKLFDAYYFAHGCGRPYQRDEEWLAFFDSIAEQIVKRIQPETVLDTGCAMGFLVEGLRKRGVEAYGLDISEYAIQNVHEDIKEYCWLGSVTESFPQKYDLIVSIEVLEHMTQPEAEKAVENICLHTDDVLFSSTPFDYKEASHFNVQPPEYWSELFALQGFLRDLDFNASFITQWAVRYRRKHETPARLVRDYERMYFQVSKENTDLRNLILENRDRLASLEDSTQSLSKGFEEKDQILRSTEEKINILKDEIKDGEDVICKLGIEINSLNDQIDNKDEQISKQNDQIDSKDEQISKQNDQIDSKDEQISKQNDQIDSKDEQISKQRKTIELLKRQVTYSNSRNEKLITQVKDLEYQTQDYKNQLLDVLNSRSWRFMKFFQRIRLRIIPKESEGKVKFLSLIHGLFSNNQIQKTQKKGSDKPENKSALAVIPYLSKSVGNLATISPLKVSLYTTDSWTGACSHIRIVGPSYHQGSGIKILEGTRWGVEPEIIFPSDADAVLLQRDIPRHKDFYNNLISWAKNRKIPTIYDIDDLLFEIPSTHSEWNYYRDVREPILRALIEADAVIASTLKLADYIRLFNPNTWVLQNYLDDNIWTLKSGLQLKKKGPLILGYMGGITQTHIPDIEMITPVLLRLLNKYKNKLLLRFWGVCPPELNNLPNVDYRTEKFPDYLEFVRYFSNQEADIFVSPLVNTHFNKFKSHIKFLEYSSLGVPGVYSRIEPYENLIIDGKNGFLASTEDDWERCLTHLIENKKLRSEIGKAAYLTVTNNYLLSHNADKWGTVYRAALNSINASHSIQSHKLSVVNYKLWKKRTMD